MGGHKQPSCDFSALCVFLGALVAGTACSLTSKVMLSMKSVGMTGEVEDFSFPLFQTFGMFLGMTFALILHFAVVRYKIPFPGYIFPNDKGVFINFDGDESPAPEPIPTWMYFLLIIPSVFDLIATALCTFGLLYVDVSIYQMLRGGAIVFVAFLKHFALQHHLRKFQWVGVFWNVVSILIVGLVAMLNSASGDSSANGGRNPVVGVFLILLGAFVQSLQYAFEEKVMTMDIPAPPMLLIGMEGLWGSLLCLFVLYPACYHLPGSDHGSIENPFNTWVMIKNSTEVQQVFLMYFLSILCYNVLACLVTFMLNSVWHAILDNFRPISVWGTDLVIFYFITKTLGESWTVWSWLQLMGMGVLLYGTAIYNAPNSGSILLKGGWQSCMLDFSEEYQAIQDELEDDLDAEVASRPLAFTSPFLTPRSRHQPLNPNSASGGQYRAVSLSPMTMNGGTPSYGTTNIQSIQAQKLKKQISFA